MSTRYTKEEKQTFKKKNRSISLFTSLILGMFIASTAYFIYNLLKLSNVEDAFRYINIALLCMLVLWAIAKNFKLRKQPKKYKFFLLIIILAAIGVGEFYVSKIISQGISSIDSLNKSNDKVKYSVVVLTLKDSELTKKDYMDSNIGIITDTEEVEGYILAEELIKKDKISEKKLVKYDSYIDMLTDLYDKKIDAAFVSGNYVVKYSELDKFKNIKSETKVIRKLEKEMKPKEAESTKASDKSVTEPFTMLLLGVDSPVENIKEAVALGDTIMIATFNPNTLNATLFSIPRDTYVPISCYGNAMSKITHAASGGDSCMINTIENFIDIKIDYYAKVNFLGLTNLVDALGGIDVNVPYSFCETDLNRSLANAVYVRKGQQHLDGRQALALSRNRKNYPTCGPEWNEGYRSDFVRGQNQQLVLKAIMNKIRGLRTIDDFVRILDTISQSMDTNLSREQILGFYNIFKKILLSTDSITGANDVISIQRTYLNGSGGIIHDYVAGTGLYEFLPSNNGLAAIIKAMKINLELEADEYDSSFTFSIDTPYEAKIIGEDIYGGVTDYPRVNIEEEQKEEEKKDEITCKKSGSVYHKFVNGEEDSSVDYTESNCVCHESSSNPGTYIDGSINSYSDSACTIIINDDDTDEPSSTDDSGGSGSSDSGSGDSGSGGSGSGDSGSGDSGSGDSGSGDSGSGDSGSGSGDSGDDSSE